MDEYEQDLQTAREISSTEHVNLQTAAEYLCDCWPGKFNSLAEYAKAITGDSAGGDVTGTFGEQVPADDAGDSGESVPASESEPV